MKNSPPILWQFVGLSLLMTALLKAEEPNPFGGNQQPPGSEYQEEDDFLDPKNSVGGFQPPVNPTQPSNQAVTPQPYNPPTQKNTSRSTITPVVPSSRTAPIQANSKKSAPKLTDYLELDSTVKGLEVKNFDLPDKEIKDVVTLISKWTGKNFILDSKVRGKITIMGTAQVTLQEAYQAFLSALEANGLTTTQSGKYIRIIEAQEARRAPVKTYTGDFAPKDDQFITRILQLKFINADEVQREFRDLTTRQGKLFAYEPTNSIIITDTGSNIQRLKEILDVLDVKNYETTLHLLKIKNTSAKNISDMLGEIYGDDKGKPGQPRSFRKSALERTRGGGIITKIITDEQTNSLVVLANQSGYDQLLKLVAKLDVKVTDTGRIHVYYCEYAKAEDLATTLASLSGGGKGGSGSSGRRTTAVGGAPGANAPAGPSGPVTAELEGGVKITSDNSTNALVITANSSDYQTIKKVIRKLDIPRLQVFVETAILEVVLNDTTSIGINAALGAPGVGFAGGFIGSPSNLTTALTRGLPGEGATIPIFAGPQFPASINIGGTAQAATVSTFMGLINLLTRTTNSSLLSTPQILALDNEKAEFQVLDETPVSSGSVAGTTGTISSTVERLKTGIVVKLTPHINAASRTVRLDIEQKVDSIKDSADVPETLRASNKATTSRVTNTSLVVKDGDFLMMGGLIADKIDEAVSKVPLLGDIPILGWLFKSRTTTKVKTNLVILLHPKIIGNSAAATKVVKDRLEKRKSFIEDNLSGDERHENRVKELNEQISEQEDRAKESPDFDYRNNPEDDGLDQPKPQLQTELAPKKVDSKEKSNPPAENKTQPVDPALGLDVPASAPDAPLVPPASSEGETK